MYLYIKYMRHPIRPVYLLFLLLTTARLTGQEQGWFLGFSTGAVGYSGDLSKGNRFSFNGGDSYLGLQLYKEGDNMLAFDVHGRMGSIRASDLKYTGDAFRQARGFSFETQWYELSMGLRLMPWPKAAISPFVSAGMGIASFRARPDFSLNRLDELNARILEDEDKYKGTAVTTVLPIGVGMRARLSPRVNLQLIAQINLTATDYMDGISAAVNANRKDHYGYLAFSAAYKLVAEDRDGDGIPDSRDECPDSFGQPSGYGCPDADGDGIPDESDECPYIPGMQRFFGCPDRDGDSIPDQKDECPDVAGLEAYKGCLPTDTDEDGIPDNEDRCPTQKGIRELQGCPRVDSDGDGISDDRDACPQMPGMTLFDGCPDADDDGIADPKDACPELFGSIEQDGCPPATTDTDISRQLNQQRFLFSPNSNQIQQERLADKLATFLRNNPAYKLRLRGYDDGGAADATEQRWAYFRVVAVHDFLTARGIAPERLVQETPAVVRPQAGAQGSPEMPNLLRRVEIWLYK